MKTIARLAAILVAAALSVAWPGVAQTNTTPPSTNAPAARPRAAGFRGTIASVDTTNMVLTLKGRGANPGAKVKVTSTTRIKKDGEPGEFSDAVEGMRVQGSGKKDEDGVWVANTLNITKPPARKPPAAAPPAPGQ